MSEYTTIKLVTRPDGSIADFDFTSYVPGNDAVSAMVKPIIDAVAATANEDLLQRQQGREQSREFFAAMMKESAKESAEGDSQDKAVDTAESAEAEAEADKAAEEACAAKAAEMTGSDETDDGASEAEKAIDVLAKRMKPEKVVAMIKRFVDAIS